jgi:hypothetical protein
MSATPSPPVSRERPQRLAIVHFLGWMLGVGAVLAIYRASIDETTYPTEWLLYLRLQQLGFGLAYGTAIGGLGLFLWRWWRGTGAGPSQPGHWLLVFGGIGLIIDVGVAAGIHLALKWSGSGVKQTDLGVFLTYQVIAWWLGSQIGLCVLARLREASAWWTAAAIVIVLTLLVNAVTCNVALVGYASGAPGSWTSQLPLMVRIGGDACSVAAMGAAVVGDWLSGPRRDWLHVVGVVAMLGLGLVDLAVNLYSLWR